MGWEAYNQGLNSLVDFAATALLIPVVVAGRVAQLKRRLFVLFLFPQEWSSNSKGENS